MMTLNKHVDQEDIYQEIIKNYLCHLMLNMVFQNVEVGLAVIVDLLVIKFKIDLVNKLIK